jgi:prepilin signal peptidase PulO-like enzyme (type II secretory pathway)
MRLGSLACDLLISIIYLMDFLYLQRGLESRPCREILYIRCTLIMRVLFCVFCMSIYWRSPPPPLHATDNSTFTFFVLQVFFKDTLYFLLKYVLLPVLFTLTQVVLLLITSTFTRVQIQSNLGTTGCGQ